MNLLKKFLFEDDDTSEIVEYTTYLKQCLPFLTKYKKDIMSGNFIVRGSNDIGTDIAVLTTPLKRMPRDSGKAFSSNFGKMMKNYLGHNFREKNVFFGRVCDEKTGNYSRC